jgi:hypothetical protein
MNQTSHQDRIGAVLIGAVVLCLAGTFLVEAHLAERHRQMEREDLDLTPTDNARSTLVIVDVTDTIGVAPAKGLVRYLEDLERFQLRRGELVSIYSAGAFIDGDVRCTFHGRFPGRDANALFETATRKSAHCDSLFSRPSRTGLEQALKPAPADQTNLAESIREAAEVEEFASGIPFRRLVIASDLLQNTRALSLYKIPLTPGLKPPPTWLRQNRANLRGVVVEVLEIARGKLRAPDRSALRSFWRAYFKASGASAVSFRMLEGE